jgi:hypothetical protein
LITGVSLACATGSGGMWNGLIMIIPRARIKIGIGLKMFS